MPDDLETITCGDATAWDSWLAANHREARGVWLRIAKQGTGVESVTNDEAVEALTAAGRMRPPGLAEVESARADGRWDAALRSAG